MGFKLPERRRFVRIEVPLKALISHDGEKYDIFTKNVSPVGLRFEFFKELVEEIVDMSIYVPLKDDPIDLKVKPIWQNKQSLEDDALYDIGVEIVKINDDDKNLFLKYLCDLLYNSTYEVRT